LLNTDSAPAIVPEVTVANYAAVCFSLIYILVTNIDTDGSLQARYWNNVEWSFSRTPYLYGAPGGITTSSKFSAISMHADKKVYTIVGGRLYQWSFIEITPMTWNSVNRIDTDTPSRGVRSHKGELRI
jgi:phosphoribosylformimino-5-aminoimidazole carboxamide ribonucleotide (ProFAR) isomerase